MGPRAQGNGNLVSLEVPGSGGGGGGAMKERPILFSGEMVKAILDGRKTVTRRVVKPQPLPPNPKDPTDPYWYWPEPGVGRLLRIDKVLARCPYGQPGDRLWAV